MGKEGYWFGFPGVLPRGLLVLIREDKGVGVYFPIRSGVYRKSGGRVEVKDEDNNKEYDDGEGGGSSL